MIWRNNKKNIKSISSVLFLLFPTVPLSAKLKLVRQSLYGQGQWRYFTFVLLAKLSKPRYIQDYSEKKLL
jgi:hypothetical protein